MEGLILVIAIAAVAVGAAWYFKIGPFKSTQVYVPPPPSGGGTTADQAPTGEADTTSKR